MLDKAQEYILKESLTFTFIYILIGQFVVLPVTFIRVIFSGMVGMRMSASDVFAHLWPSTAALGFFISLFAGFITYGRMASELHEAEEVEKHERVARLEQEAREAAEQERRQREYEMQRRENAARQAAQARASDREIVEAKVLKAFAQHTLDHDFTGTMPPAELHRSFQPCLAQLSGHELTLLRESPDPRIRALLSSAPAVIPNVGGGA